MSEAAAAPASAETAERRPSAVEALRYRPFALFWAGAVVSNTGTWMQSLAVPYVIYQTTGSPAWVGLAAFMQFFPTVPMAPLGGFIADRYPRRLVLMVTQSMLALLAVGMWALWTSGVRSPLALVTIVGLTGVVAGVNIPSWQSFLSELVPRDALLNAVTLNSAQFNASRAIGPALGGFVVGTLGPGWAFLINAVSFGAVLGALLLIQVPRRPIVHHSGSVLAQYADGIRHLWSHAGMRTAFVLAVLMAFLGNPMLQLATVVAHDVYAVGATALGALLAAFGTGAVIGVPLLGRYGAGRPRSLITQVSFTLFAVAVVAFGLAPTLAWGMAAFALAGFGYLIAVATLNTTLQLQVAEELRGRVLGFYIAGFTTAFPIGALLQGWLADVVGVQATIVAAGVALVIISLTLWVSPRLVRPIDVSAAAADDVDQDVDQDQRAAISAR